jgi:hypothetical protein
MKTSAGGGGAWPWPEELDALRAASKTHSLVFENDRVRVLEVRIAPGETVPVHTHRWQSVIHRQSGGHYIRRDGQGNVLHDTREDSAPPKTPVAVWTDRLPPHSVENVGEEEIRLFTVELKDIAG